MNYWWFLNTCCEFKFRGKRLVFGLNDLPMPSIQIHWKKKSELAFAHFRSEVLVLILGALRFAMFEVVGILMREITISSMCHIFVLSRVLRGHSLLNRFLDISVRDPRKIIRVSRNSKLDPRNSILDPWKSKLDSLFSKTSRIENRVSSRDCQLTFERYCTTITREVLQLSALILFFFQFALHHCIWVVMRRKHLLRLKPNLFIGRNSIIYVHLEIFRVTTFRKKSGKIILFSWSGESSGAITWKSLKSVRSQGIQSFLKSCFR